MFYLLNFSVVLENSLSDSFLYFRIEPRRIRWDERQFLELNLVHEDPTLMLDV
jgi:hypothetical protein